MTEHKTSEIKLYQKQFYASKQYCALIQIPTTTQIAKWPHRCSVMEKILKKWTFSRSKWNYFIKMSPIFLFVIVFWIWCTNFEFAMKLSLSLSDCVSDSDLNKRFLSYKSHWMHHNLRILSYSTSICCHIIYWILLKFMFIWIQQLLWTV